jgi:copper transport protein
VKLRVALVAGLAAFIPALALIFGIGLSPASAHAVVVSSSPTDGSSLAAAPGQVTITFDEAVGLSPGYLRVVDSSGRRVESGSAFHPNGQGDEIAVNLEADLPAAAYIASYRVVSADSHPVGGVVRFAVGGASLNDVANVRAGSSTNSTVSTVLDVSRAISFIGLAVAGGGWLVLVIVLGGAEWPRRSRAVLGAGLAAAGLGALAELLLQGPYAAGTGLSGLGQGRLLADTMSSSFGAWHLVELAALIVLGVAVGSSLHGDAVRYPRPFVVVGGGLWLLALIAVGATGHAAATDPIWLSELSIDAHLITMSTWVGGLVMLGLVVLGGPPDDADRALRFFSPTALVCVALIAGSGAYQSWKEVGSWSAFVDTRYGALVLVKIGLFAILIALGYLARWLLRWTDDDRHRRLRRSVLVEVVLAVAVLSVSGVLVAEPPGRTASAEVITGSGAQTVALDASRTLTVQAIPAQAGPVIVSLSVSGGPAVQSMTVTASLPSQSIGPIPIPVSSLGRQNFGSVPTDLPGAGIWQFTVNVQTSDFDVVTATVSITLR